MSLWGNKDANTSAPKHKHIVSTSPARGNVVYANTTPNSFTNNRVVGLYGVADSESNTAGVAHTGWVIVRQGMGGVAAFTVSNTGTAFANGETVTVSGGGANALGVVSTNATSSIVSISVVTPGTFTNTASATVAFNREKHLANVTLTGTATGYNNTDVITVSNGTINASATLTTNSTGGISNNSFTITNVGLFGNAQSNAQAVVAIANSTGGASAGSGATFSVNLAASTNGGATITLGGRAGRTTYETLVAGSIQNNVSNPFGL